MNQWLALIQSKWLEHWVTWAFFGGYLVLTWVAAWVAKRVMKGVITRLTARSQTALDDRLVEVSTRPVGAAVLAVGLRLSLETLQTGIPSLAEGGRYATQFGWAQQIVLALLILAVTRLVNALMKAGADWYLHELAGNSRATWDKELLPLIKRVLSLVIYFIGISIILDECFGLEITALITTAGVASLAVALAAQETLSNMLGGLVILVDRPFRVGDLIELTDGKSGTVVEIGLRSTRIRQFDGNALVVPNKDMASSRIINYALPNERAAIRQTIGVAYGTDIEKAKRVLLDTLKAHPEVLEDPAPGVWFTTFNASSLDLFMSAWVESYNDRFRVMDELNVAILRAFRENRIEIPYPQRDVHVHLPEGNRVTVEKTGA